MIILDRSIEYTKFKISFYDIIKEYRILLD